MVLLGVSTGKRYFKFCRLHHTHKWSYWFSPLKEISGDSACSAHVHRRAWGCTNALPLCGKNTRCPQMVGHLCEQKLSLGCHLCFFLKNVVLKDASISNPSGSAALSGASTGHSWSSLCYSA